MDEFDFRVRETGGRTLLAELRGGLAVGAENSFQEILSLLRDRQARACVLDGSGLSGSDGAGLFAFGKFCVRASKTTGSLSAFGLSKCFRDLLGLLGFPAYLAFHASKAGALAAAGGSPGPDEPGAAEGEGSFCPVGWMDPGKAGPSLVGPLAGFGALWHKAYRVRFPAGDVTPEHAARLMKEGLPDFWPPGNRLILPAEGVTPGAVAQIVLRLAGGVPLHTGAQVIHADELSFTLAALAGHVEAGWIHFGAATEGPGTVVQVQSLGRGGDPLYEIGLRLFGHGEQERFWRDTLERMASGMGGSARVETAKSCIDPGVRWPAVANIRHSSALRTPLVLLGNVLGSEAPSAVSEEPAPIVRHVAAGPDRRPDRRTILILGGGYGGLACLRALSGHLPRLRYRIQLIDATPDHTIKTRFHERAVLESREPLIRLPLSILAAASGAEFLQDEVVEIDFRGREVKGRKAAYSYDRVVVALGGQIAYFGVEGAAEHTVSLQTHAQAVEACRRVTALRHRGDGGAARRIVVVGAGIEGLEVATMLRQEIPAGECEILVLERSQMLMAQSQCRKPQREHVQRYLAEKGISLRRGAAIRAVGPGHVELESGERLPSDLTFWCSGVQPVPVKGAGDGGAFRVGPFLQSEDHPEVFAVGDFATVDSLEEGANLRSAQRASYQGTLVGENLCLLEEGRPMKRSRYRPIGELTALGDRDGVGLVLGVPLTGLRVALLKKAHEAKYLADAFSQLPGAVGRGLLALGTKSLGR